MDQFGAAGVRLRLAGATDIGSGARILDSGELPTPTLYC